MKQILIFLLVVGYGRTPSLVEAPAQPPRESAAAPQTQPDASAAPDATLEPPRQGAREADAGPQVERDASELLQDPAVPTSAAQVPDAAWTAPPPAAPAVVPAPSPDSPPEMAWFIPSLRFGMGRVSLSPEGATFMDDERARCAEQGGDSGPWFAPSPGSQRCDLGIREPFASVGAGFHLGGDYYFFRMDAWYAWNNAVRMFGLGFYPLNFGWFIPSLGLFPYASGGYAFDYVKPRITDERGLIVRARLSLGVKKRVHKQLGLGLEAAYSPRSSGIIADSAGTSSHGGNGSAWDLALSVEWF